ncbi:MAG: nitrate ABC transporter substrate-binding protein [Sphingomonadales bacterium]|nr:MAG: nitrate ABC transporter substrate-binding protein [Sphingomonadales bacterium]
MDDTVIGSGKLARRREFLRLAGGATATAALIGAVKAAFPAGAHAAGAGAETKTAKLGYIALTDASPLIIAREKGFFAKYGLPGVEVLKQASWAATRDNLELGSGGGGIDGAHILTPMPYFMTLGTVTKNNVPVPMHILARLNTNGQGISVEKEYLSAKVQLDAGKMRGIIESRKAKGNKIAMAMTFPGGTHDLWLRYWLAAGGIDPNRDVEVITVPPPQMVANMKVETMEAFCVGEPWNDQLVAQKVGYTAVSTGQLWLNHPEKSLGLRADWVAKHPRAAQALTAAVIEAQQWCEANKEEMAQIVSGRDWFKVPVTDIVDRIKGDFTMGDGRAYKNADFAMKFWRDSASYPFQSHDLWFITENKRWGYLKQSIDAAAVIKKVNREDIWRSAAKLAGVPAAQIPKGTSRGVEKFFDGKVFDPAKPDAYLASLAIKKTA